MDLLTWVKTWAAYGRRNFGAEACVRTIEKLSGIVRKPEITKVRHWPSRSRTGREIGATEVNRSLPPKPAPTREPRPMPPVTWRFTDWAMI
jgi:hypothetical protein